MSMGSSSAAPPPASDDGGVDTSLIDEMLALTPTERLRLNDRTVAALEELRRGLEPDQPGR
jgi:hypothetical protein